MFNREASSSHNLDRENIASDGCYDYDDDIHDLLNENFGSGTSTKLDDLCT